MKIELEFCVDFCRWYITSKPKWILKLQELLQLVNSCYNVFSYQIWNMHAMKTVISSFESFVSYSLVVEWHCACGTVACNGPSVHHWSDRRRKHWWNASGQGRSEILGERLVSVPFLPPQIAHGLLWNRTWVSGLRNAWPVARLPNVCSCLQIN